MTRHNRPQRKVVFLGCEGASEHAYGQLLNKLLRDRSLAHRLEVRKLNPGAGSPEAMVTQAIKRIAEFERNRDRLVARWLLIDQDVVTSNPARKAQIDANAQSQRIQIIWQNPCHEAMLLRHLPNAPRTTLTTAAHAGRAIQRVWPGYQKGMDSTQLVARLDQAALQRAASVEPILCSLLQSLGLI